MKSSERVRKTENAQPLLIKYSHIKGESLVLNKERNMPKLLLTSSAIALVLMINGCSDNDSTKTTSTTTTTTNAPALTFNTPPTANAGSDLIVSVGEVVTLNGTQSADPDNDLMSFSWTQDSGESVEILNADVYCTSKQTASHFLIDCQ